VSDRIVTVLASIITPSIGLALLVYASQNSKIDGMGGWIMAIIAIAIASVTIINVVVVILIMIVLGLIKTILSTCKHYTIGASKQRSLCEDCVQEDILTEENRQAQVREAEIRLREYNVRMQAERVRQQEEEDRRRIEAEHLEKQRLERAQSIEFLLRQSDEEFQLLVWSMYRQLGWKVIKTPFRGDGGVDGFIVRDSDNLILQCKKYTGAVHQPVLRELFGTYKHHEPKGVNGAVMVTTGTISRGARQFAKGKNINLVDGDKLLSLLKEANIQCSDGYVPETHDYIYPNQAEESKSGVKNLCPKCRSGVVQRKQGRFGQFFGCSRYPQCNYSYKKRRRY